MGCILHFIFVLPIASSGYIQCGLITSAAWSFFCIFSSYFKSRKSALNRMNHLHLGVAWVYAFCLVGETYGRLFGMSVCAYVCQYIYKAICPMVYPLGQLGVHLGVCEASFCLCVQLFVHRSSSCVLLSHI